MRQSELFTKVERAYPKDEEAANAKLLMRAGFIDKTMAGVYSFLPLGLRVLQNIENIVRREMDRLGAQEILMPALHPKELWQKTKRWDSFDALLKVVSHFDMQFALGPTHEETMVPIAQRYAFSYKDLPFGAYQIQTKFRDEARSKSGLLRGREFRMKDLYSFHASADDLLKYYEKVKKAYGKIFKAMGLQAIAVEASGGSFSKYSHEFQVIHPAGEDVIYHCACGFAKNREIMPPDFQSLAIGATAACPDCGGTLSVSSGIEVGNIFQLGTKYSDPFGFVFKDKNGAEKAVTMGCYGIGTGRAMGAVVEMWHDDRGIIWPARVAPFAVHLLELNGASAAALYDDLHKEGISVLYDDRKATAGEKLMDADMIGIPWRFVVSPQTGANVEVKRRNERTAKPVALKEAHVLARHAYEESL